MSRTPIDPRIRQRRIEVQRETGRRRLRRLLMLVGLLAAIVLTVFVALSPVLDVDRIAVQGSGVTPADLVISASGITQGDPMVVLDVDAATHAVEALPWVASASIRRDFPASVEIEVVERTPIGILRAGPSELLVDRTGRVLGPVQFGFGDLARAEVAADLPAPGQTVDADALALLDLLETVGDGIDGHNVLIAQGGGGALSLLIDQSIAVDFGTAERVEAKVRAVATVLDQVDLTCVETIDVRIAERPVLTRDEPCAGPT